MKIQENEGAGSSSSDERLTLNDVLAIFQETDKKIQEIGRLLRQNEKLMKELTQKSAEIFL
jgi:hypothetical protein